MCILYAIKLWMKHGGKILVMFHPFFHVMVCAKGKIYHGTTKSKNGKWRVEEIDVETFAKLINRSS